MLGESSLTFLDGLISTGMILMNEHFSLFDELGIQKGLCKSLYKHLFAFILLVCD